MFHNMTVYVSYLWTRNPLAGRVNIQIDLCAAENHKVNFNDSWHLPNLKCLSPESVKSYGK
jgi:hypothetical protein